MDETVNVASRSPMALRIQEPLPEQFKDKPGEAPELRSGVLFGANHTERRGVFGITRGVHAGMFRAWLDAHPHLRDVVREVSDEELQQPVATEFGFEPGLKRMEESQKAAAEGSTVTHDGPATATDMAATSDTPNDDSPRGDPDGGMPVMHTQEPATAMVVEGEPAGRAGPDVTVGEPEYKSGFEALAAREAEVRHEV